MHPYLQSLLGGVLIGIAAVILLLGNGRIAGISGIFGELVQGRIGKQGWRIAFIVGLLISIWIYYALGGALEMPIFNGGAGIAIVAGLLVGFGTALGKGCTSGHGVCGLANLSLRSLVATLTFMLTAGITVFVVKHLL